MCSPDKPCYAILRKFRCGCHQTVTNSTPNYLARNKAAVNKGLLSDYDPCRTNSSNVNGSYMHRCSSSFTKRLLGCCLSPLTVETNLTHHTTDVVKTLVNAFITSRVGHFNNVFENSAAIHLHPLQFILNAAAKLIKRKQKYDHIAPAMRDELHWLPVLQRLE